MPTTEEFDIKNINWSKVSEDFSKRPEILICSAIVIISFFILINIFTLHNREKLKLKASQSDLASKEEVLSRLTAAQKQLETYIAELPKGIDGDATIEKVSDFAALRNVQILSFSPTKKETYKLFDRSSVSLSITATDYQNVVLFIGDIEQLPNNLKIEKWNGTVQMTGEQRPSATNPERPPQTIIAKLDISSVTLKNEK